MLLIKWLRHLEQNGDFALDSEESGMGILPMVLRVAWASCPWFSDHGRDARATFDAPLQNRSRTPALTTVRVCGSSEVLANPLSGR